MNLCRLLATQKQNAKSVNEYSIYAMRLTQTSGFMGTIASWVMKTEKVWTKDEIVSIPLSFGIFTKGNSKRHTTGFIEATFLEYTPEGLANIQLGLDIFTVSKSQLTHKETSQTK
jgi:hypothetical protein